MSTECLLQATGVTLQDRLFAAVDLDPHRNAIAYYDAGREVNWIAAGDLHRQATGLAAKLAADGLRQGDVCIIVLRSGESSALAFYACLLLGAVPLNLAPPVLQGGYSDLGRILAFALQKTGSRIVVCDHLLDLEQHPMPEGAAPRLCVLPDELPTGPGDESIAPVTSRESDVVAMQLTSGTTGLPKICVWEQRALTAALDGMATAMRLNEDDVCLNWTPLYHDMGLVNNFLLCLTHGIPLVMLDPHAFVKKPALWLQGLSDAEATISWSPNFGFALAAQRTNDDELAGVRLDRVRGLWNAAERVHIETIREFYHRFRVCGLRPEAMRTNYGLAENIGGATFSRDHLNSREPEADEFEALVEHVDRQALQEERIAVTVDDPDAKNTVGVVNVGAPHPKMRIAIFSPDGTALPDGQVGEIGLNTPSRFKHYLDDPDATAAAVLDEFLRTGDLGYLRGGDLFWVGRVQERITVFGKKIDPSDFEPIVNQVDGLRAGNFAAFGIEDVSKGTESIVLIAEMRASQPRERSEIIAELRQTIFQRMAVHVGDIRLVEAGLLSKTSSGKRRHRHFKQLYLAGAFE